MTASRFKSIIERWSQIPATRGTLGLLEFWLRDCRKKKLLCSLTSMQAHWILPIIILEHWVLFTNEQEFLFLELQYGHFWPCRLFKNLLFTLSLVIWQPTLSNSVHAPQCNENFHHCAICNTPKMMQFFEYLEKLQFILFYWKWCKIKYCSQINIYNSRLHASYFISSMTITYFL